MKEYDIFIVSNDCGDFPFKDLITLKDNEIVSKLLIESDSWNIEKDEKNIRDETINTFIIDRDLNIKVKTVKKLNDDFKSETMNTYQIIDGKIVKNNKL